MKFKKTLLSIMGMIVFSVNADTELPEAPTSVVKDFIHLCTEYSIEEGVNKDDLDAYLLDCVNSDLEEDGWKKIEKLTQDSDPV